MQSLDQLFTEEESILTRRVSGASGLACERADRERAHAATPEGIAEDEARRARWAAASPDPEPEDDPDADGDEDEFEEDDQ